VFASNKKRRGANKKPNIDEAAYGWMPHNASFGFLDIPSAALGQIHF
jgi:hypothetical protein